MSSEPLPTRIRDRLATTLGQWVFITVGNVLSLLVLSLLSPTDVLLGGLAELVLLVVLAAALAVAPTLVLTGWRLLRRRRRPAPASQGAIE